MADHEHVAFAVLTAGGRLLLQLRDTHDFSFSFLLDIDQRGCGGHRGATGGGGRGRLHS